MIFVVVKISKKHNSGSFKGGGECIKTISAYIFPEIATKSNKFRFNTFPVYISRPYFLLSDVVHGDLFTLPFLDTISYESHSTRKAHLQNLIHN